MPKKKLNLLIIIRSCLFWPIAAAALPLYNILAVLASPFPARLRFTLVMSISHYFTFLLKHLGGIKYQVLGLENLPQQPSIVVSNHQSTWETVAFNCIFPDSVWIMKKEVLQIPLYGWGVRALSPIAIDRSRGEAALAQMIKQGKERFSQGFWITVFPEGTRVAPKKRKAFKHGSAKLALELGVPVIPVAHNAGYCMPRKSFWLYPGMVTVVVGAPIYPDPTKDALAFTHKIQSWVFGQLEQMEA